MRIVYWLRRDLRLTDNPALNWACAQASELTLVYIHDEQVAIGAASRWWLHESLAALDAQLRQHGQSLLYLTGDSQSALGQLVQHLRADAVCWNRVYEPHYIQRDQAIKRELNQQGLQVQSFNAALLLEPGQLLNKQDQPYRVFTPFWKAAQRSLSGLQAVSAPPKLPARCKDAPTGLALDELALHPRHPWADKLARHWQAGEAAALDRLDQFVDSHLQSYSAHRDIPAVAGTSRLSPHLHFGEIGPHQLRAALSQAPELEQSKFFSELGWREFAQYLLYHFPDTTEQAFNPRFRTFPWATASSQAEAFQRWCEGSTGIELVDAGMRELWQTGFMHNRVRMLVGSFLTKNLGIHWRDGARWFFDTLVDADLASNTLGWQWVAGCGADAAPYFRIFNPDTQAQKFDPQAVYRRQWLDRHQNKPMVDLRLSRQQALERYQQHRAAQ